MHKIYFVADKRQLAASGVDVTIVSLGDLLRPDNVLSGQWAIAVGARGGSMWQLISRPLPSREEAEQALANGFEPISSEVGVRWARSLLSSRVAQLVLEDQVSSTTMRVSGKRRQIKELNEAYARAEAAFGRLRVSNPPEECDPPEFRTTAVSSDEARAYRNWFEESFGIKSSSIKCELAPLARAS